MADSYPGISGPEGALLDEILCEYVDGTLDRTIRVAFEECMSDDKSLAERVECLRKTRQLLERYRCRETRDVHLRVRERLFHELQAMQKDGPVFKSLTPFIGTGAIAALMLCATLFAGAPEGRTTDNPEIMEGIQSPQPLYKDAARLDSVPTVLAPAQLAGGPLPFVPAMQGAP